MCFHYLQHLQLFPAGHSRSKSSAAGTGSFYRPCFWDLTGCRDCLLSLWILAGEEKWNIARLIPLEIYVFFFFPRLSYWNLHVNVYLHMRFLIAHISFRFSRFSLNLPGLPLVLEEIDLLGLLQRETWLRAAHVSFWAVAYQVDPGSYYLSSKHAI